MCGNWNTCSEIRTHSPRKVLEPPSHKDHFWPLTALTDPREPPHPHLPVSGLQTWLFIDRFGMVLLRIAYLSLQLCLHHKKIISCDYLLFLICSLYLFSSLSLFCRFPLHSALLLHDPPHPLPRPHLYPCLSFSHSLLGSFFFILGVEVVNREGLISSTVSLWVSFVQALLGQLPIHTALPIRTPFREHERGHEMRSVTPPPTNSIASLPRL